MIKKLLLYGLLAVGYLVSAKGADETKAISYFNAKELSVSLNSGYVVDTDKGFQDNYAFNISAGVGYYFTKYLGATVNLPFYETKGVSLHEIDAGLVARLPIGRFAPYVGASALADWTTDNQWKYIGRAGLEFRINPKVGLFSEWQYRDNNLNFDQGEHKLVGGVKIVF